MPRVEVVAANGLLHRRLFLKEGAGLAGLALLRATPAAAGAVAGRARVDEGARPGHAAVWRTIAVRVEPFSASWCRCTGTTGSGSSRTPLEHLEGIITPSSLHFERHHSGVPGHPAGGAPAADPRPGRASADLRPCSAVPLSAGLAHPLHRVFGQQHRALCGGAAAGRRAGALHGLVSCSEWTGVPLSTLLDEAGREARGRWLLAEGGDAAAMSRSIPMEKALDDAMIAIYQNGERLRPGERLSDAAAPARLGRQHEREVAAAPEGGRRAGHDEGRDVEVHRPACRTAQALQFTFPMGVKSVITSPSGGSDDAGARPVSDLGPRVVRRRDGFAASRCRPTAARAGRQAALSEPVLPKALTRFRMAWRVGRRSGGADEPRDRRDRRRAADARGRSSRSAARRSLSLQRDPELERERRRGGAQCLRRNAADESVIAALVVAALATCRRRPPRPRRHRGVGSAEPQGPGLGVPATAADRRLGRQHRPDGAGLPPGSRHAGAGRGDLQHASASPATAEGCGSRRTIGWSAGRAR